MNSVMSKYSYGMKSKNNQKSSPRQETQIKVRSYPQPLSGLPALHRSIWWSSLGNCISKWASSHAPLYCGKPAWGMAQLSVASKFDFYVFTDYLAHSTCAATDQVRKQFLTVILLKMRVPKNITKYWEFTEYCIFKSNVNHSNLIFDLCSEFEVSAHHCFKMDWVDIMHKCTFIWGALAEVREWHNCQD